MGNLERFLGRVASSSGYCFGSLGELGWGKGGISIGWYVVVVVVVVVTLDILVEKMAEKRLESEYVRRGVDTGCQEYC
jgi:hypothetical protein